MAKGTLRVNGVLIAEDTHELLLDSTDGTSNAGDNVLDEDGFEILLESSPFYGLQASTGDNVVIREDDGTAVLVVDTNGKTTITGSGDLEVRAGAATPGKLLLTTDERSVVDGNKLGQIDFQAPFESAGTDAILVGASIHAEADATFSSSVNATELVFSTGASETAAEKMRITSDGKVGIGSTSPVSLLDVAGEITVQSKINAAAGTSLSLQSGTSAAVIVNTNGANERIRITSAGNVGIGSNSPSYLMHVAGTLGIKATEPSFYFDRAGAYTWSIRQGDGTGSFPLSTLNVVNNGGTPTMTFEDGGYVGIGTSNPDSPLHIRSADNALLHLESTDQDALFKLEDNGSGHFQINVAGDIASFGTSHSSEMLRFSGGTSPEMIVINEDGNTQNLRIESNNNANMFFVDGANDRVGVGTDAPSNQFTVYGSSTNQTAIDGSSVLIKRAYDGLGAGDFQSIKARGSLASPTVVQDGDNLWTASAVGYDGSNYKSSGYLKFSVDGTVTANKLGSKFEIATNVDTAGQADTSTVRFVINDSGDTYTKDGTVNTISDIRVKKDIVDLTDGLDIVNQLRPRTFKYNGKTSMGVDNDEIMYGFIADEVLTVASQYVKITSEVLDGKKVEDFKNLSTTKMIPMLVKAVQELSAKVKALESAE